MSWVACRRLAEDFCPQCFVRIFMTKPVFIAIGFERWPRLTRSRQTGAASSGVSRLAALRYMSFSLSEFPRILQFNMIAFLKLHDGTETKKAPTKMDRASLYISSNSPSGGRGLYFIIAKTAFKAIRVPINNAALAIHEK